MVQRKEFERIVETSARK